MKKNILRLLSAAMCLIMVLGLMGGCSAPETEPDAALDGDEHDEDTSDLIVDLGAEEKTPLAGGTCNGRHSWDNGHWETNANFCAFSKCDAFVKNCTVCGAKTYIAFRNTDSTGGKSHSFTTVTLDGGCPRNPSTESTCTVCGHTVTTIGTHKWVTTTTKDATCAERGEITKTCECGETETEYTAKLAHTWGSDTKTVAATCTEIGRTYLTCTVCGEERNTATTAPLGHKWVAKDPDDASQGMVCERCGVDKPDGTDNGCKHIWGALWRSDASEHWLECVECHLKDARSAHIDRDGDSKCDVCEYQIPKVCQHGWTVTAKIDSLSHKETCYRCGETRIVQCASAGREVPHDYCTDATYCACGNKIKDGEKNHNFGAWAAQGDAHERKCTNVGCNYKTTEPHKAVKVKTNDCTAAARCSVCGALVSTGAYSAHEYSGAWKSGGDGTHYRTCVHPGCTHVERASHTVANDDGNCTTPITCTVCGEVITHSYTSHEYGAWISVGQSGHRRTCVHPSCQETQTLAHSGTGTCTGKAVCSDCGAQFTLVDKNNHVGGTTVKNARPAEVGVEGYTGDVVCAGCGEVLQKGEKIEALKPDHVHAYADSYKSDSTSHWTECECGDKKDVTAHTFDKGVCTVCGEKDPNYVEEHVHKFADVWKSDITSHWHICETCGEIVDVSEHLFIDDKCVDCGLTFARHEVLEQVQEEKAAAQEILKTESIENVVVKFDDVKEGTYYTEAVQRLYTSGLMKGADDNTFNVGGTATRIQIMTVIARMNNVEGADSENWSEAKKAVTAWAEKNNIASTANQGDAITREELVLMLWRNAGKPESHRDLGQFKDADALEGDVRAAMAWAVEEGIIQGSNGSIKPTATATRGQIATILARYMDAAV